MNHCPSEELHNEFNVANIYTNKILLSSTGKRSKINTRTVLCVGHTCPCGPSSQLYSYRSSIWLVHIKKMSRHVYPPPLTPSYLRILAYKLAQNGRWNIY